MAATLLAGIAYAVSCRDTPNQNNPPDLYKQSDLSQSLASQSDFQIPPYGIENLIAIGPANPLNGIKLDFKYYHTKSKNRTRFNSDKEVYDFLKSDKYDLVEIVQLGSASPAAVIYREGNLTFVKYSSEALGLQPTPNFDGFSLCGAWGLECINQATEKILERLQQGNP